MGNDSLLWIAPLHDFALCMLNVTPYGFWPLATQSSTPRFEVDQLANRSFERNAQLKNRMFHMIRDNEKQKINEDPTFHPGKQEIIPFSRPVLTCRRHGRPIPMSTRPARRPLRLAKALATAVCAAKVKWKAPGRVYPPHRIHGAGIYANIGGILMVNVTIYSIHGSYGLWQMLTVSELENQHFLKHGLNQRTKHEMFE